MAQIANGIDEFVNTTKAAEIIGIKPQTLYMWRSTKRHQIKFYKIGGSIRYKLKDLDKWLEEQAVEVSE